MNRNFISILALGILGAAPMTGCGKAKDTLNTMRGIKKDKNTPYAVNKDILPGTYASNSRILRFTNSTVEIYSSLDGAVPCASARPYHTEGSTIVLEATAACPADKIETISQSTDKLNLSDASHYEELNKVDDAGAREALFAFKINPDDVPASLKPLLPQEPTDAAVDAARAGFRGELTGAHLKLKKPVNDLTGDKPSQLNGLEYIVGFHQGQAFKPKDEPSARSVSFDIYSLNRPSQLDGVNCYLWTERTLGSEMFTSFDLRLAQVQVSHSRQTKGRWSLSQLQLAKDSTGATAISRTPTESTGDNYQRDNMVNITFEDTDAPTSLTTLERDLTISCFKTRGADVITLGDVKAAFGDYLEVSKP